MAKTNVSTIATRRDTLAITGAGIIAALGGAVAVSTAKAEAPAINPELARLIAVETEAKAAYEAASAPFHAEDRARSEKRPQVSDEEWERIEQAEADHVNAWADTQEDVLAFPAIERCDVIAKAKWLADRYPKEQDFLPTDAAALWSAFFTIANTTD
mgnify:CR=1 FL=1